MPKVTAESSWSELHIAFEEDIANILKVPVDTFPIEQQLRLIDRAAIYNFDAIDIILTKLAKLEQEQQKKE